MKAKLFPDGELVVDACCGAGVDTVALCCRGEVLAVDRDPLMTRLAASNAAAHGEEPRVCSRSFDADFVQHLPDACRWLHIDPDRRASPNRGADRRTTQADQFSPALDEILVAAARFDGAVVKLAPSTRMAESVEAQLESQANRLWLGNMGECRQQLLLLGELATADRGIRRAVLAEPPAASLQPDEDRAGELHTFSSSVLRFPQCVDEPAGYVYDLHPVLHAAKLQAAWGEAHGLRPLGGEHGYYCGPSPISSPWAQCFEIKAVLAWDDRKVRRWLRGANAGTVEVKNRLVRLDANAIQRRYSGPGTARLTLLVTQIGDRVRAIAARRL